METTNCRTCKEVISQQAAACPHCGTNQAKASSGSKAQAIVLVAMLLIAAIAGLTSIL